MRSIITYITSCIAVMVFGQTVPNGNFEKWQIRDHYKLDGWYSPTRNVERTTDAKVGSYAIRLSNTYSETSNGTTGYFRNLDYNNKDTLNGFAFDGDPLSMVFWSKHELAVGDTARAYVVFREKGVYRGKVDFRFTGSSNGEFVKYNVPIEWSGARTPDSAWVYLYSYVNSKVNGDGYVIFDDFHFEKIGERLPELPNGDFEQWTNIGVEYPVEWRSIDLQAYDGSTYFYSPRAVTQVTGSEAFLNGTSVVLNNYESGGTPRSSYCYIGTENNDYYTPTFPISDTFRYLQGYYKYLPDGDDTARVNFRAWESGKSRVYDNLYLTEAKEWTFFSLELNYDAQKYKPDSAALIFWSTSTAVAYGVATKFYIDNLELVMTPAPLKLSIANVQKQVKIFPNPTNNGIQIETKFPIHHAEIVGTLGTVTVLAVLNDSADLSKLSPGVYYLKIFLSEHQFETHKLIKTSEL
jgi:hypothetical protein